MPKIIIIVIVIYLMIMTIKHIKEVDGIIKNKN